MLIKCKHDTILKNCKICMGSAICEHKRERYRCRECKGGGSCEHKNDKRWCRICTKVHTPGMMRKLNRCIKVPIKKLEKKIPKKKPEKKIPNKKLEKKIPIKKPEPLKKQILKKYKNEKNRCFHGYNKKTCCICKYTPVKIEYSPSSKIDFDWINTKKSNIYDLNHKYLNYQFKYELTSNIKPPLILGLFRRDRVVDFLNKYGKRY